MSVNFSWALGQQMKASENYLDQAHAAARSMDRLSMDLGFLEAYAAGPDRMRALAEVTEKEAARAVKAFMMAFPGIRRFVLEVQETMEHRLAMTLEISATLEVEIMYLYVGGEDQGPFGWRVPPTAQLQSVTALGYSGHGIPRGWQDMADEIAENWIVANEDAIMERIYEHHI